jgi:hypothetical protein
MDKVKVEMTAEEQARFAQFKAEEEKKAKAEKAKAERETYKQMVDDEVSTTIPILLELSGDIRTIKQKVVENFKTIIATKVELFKTKNADQRSHTFTTSDGNMRLTIGQYTTDGYRDTVEDGIAIVKEYITSLAKDTETQALVNMVFRLLSRDKQGTLKASRIVQLRKIAEDNGNERFLEGVRIIEESYQPTVSKQFIRAEVRDDNDRWRLIPLGMTES